MRVNQYDTVSACIEAIDAGEESPGSVVSTVAHNALSFKGGNCYEIMDAGSGARPAHDNGAIIHVGSSGLYLCALFPHGRNVYQWGALGNRNDDTEAIQSAISASYGQTLYIHNDKYRLTRMLSVENTITIIGESIYPECTEGTEPDFGTIFLVDFIATDENPNVFYVTNAKITNMVFHIENIEFYSTLQTPPADYVEPESPDKPDPCGYKDYSGPEWNPANLPVAISVLRHPYQPGPDNTVIKNVMFRNLNDGIKIRGSQRAVLDHIYGQTFGTMIDLDGIYDVARISNVHHWFFWQGPDDVWLYQRNAAIGIRFGRVDSPIITNVFLFQLFKAILFDDTGNEVHPPGATERAQFSNIGLDGTRYGIYFNNTKASVTVSFTNLYIYSQSPQQPNKFNGSRGIFSQAGAHPVFLSIDNGDFHCSDCEAVRLSAPGSKCFLSNTRVRSANKLRPIYTAAIQALAGTEIYVSNTFVDTRYTGGEKSEFNGDGTLIGTIYT